MMRMEILRRLILTSDRRHSNVFFMLVISFLILLPGEVFSQVRLPQLVGDHMVLQRDTKVRIWGWAAPGEQVTLRFMDKNHRTRADRDGQWSVSLPPMPAGGPHQMDIRASNRLTVRDILIGDVWFSSGQSNMVLPMERIKEAFPKEIAAADYPQIRNFFVPTVSDVQTVHADLPPGQWKVTTPENVLGMGGATYFFAKAIHEKYGIPIGIINSSVGGTPAEAWISAEGLRDLEPYASRVRDLRDTTFFQALLEKHRPEPARPIPDVGTSGDLPWYDPAFRPSGWRSFWMPGYWDDQGTRNLRGILWFRKEIEVPASMAGKPAKLFLGAIVDADDTYVNGVKVGHTGYQYPPRRYTVPEGVLKAGQNTIVIRVTNTGGKGGFVPGKSYVLTNGTDSIDLRGDWQYQVGGVQAPRKPGEQIIQPFSAQNEPTGLYNTMVAPAVGYAVKGFLWYQGETNTHYADNYQQIMHALITDWRAQWGIGELPFVFAQLPEFMQVDFSPAESNWARLREQQRQTLTVPRTAMAVTLGLGEWNDIHPLNKKGVGERMALAAGKIAYDDSVTVHSGPLYRSHEITGSRIVLSFDHTGGGLVARDGGELCHFAIAGADRHFVWAQARIEGDQVIVWSDEIPEPLYVRYAWADNPECANLTNREGLPASPFQTL